MERINLEGGTRATVLRAAEWQFVAKGYEGVTLDDIAEELGVPTSTVASHFATTEDMLEAIMVPFYRALDRAIAQYAGHERPLSPVDRIALLAVLVDIYCEHRAVLLLLLREIASNWPVYVNPQHAQRHERLVALLAGDHASGEHRAVVNAVLGVITRPLLDPDVDTDDVRTRRLLVAMGTDTGKRLGSEASRSWSDGPRASEPHHGFVSP